MKNKSFFCFWVLIFILFLPAFFNVFPGILAWDFSMQVHTFSKDAYDFYINVIKDAGLDSVYQRGDVIFYNFHPILHTSVIRICIKLGMLIFNSQEAGIAIYNVAQMLLLSFALARMADTLYKRNVHILIVLGLCVFWGLWPVNHLLVVSVVKDTPFIAFFVLFMCEMAHILKDGKEYFKNKSKYICFALIVFFMCAFRKNGIHVYVFSIIIWLLGYMVKAIKNRRKGKDLLGDSHIFMMFFLPLVLWIIYTGPIYKALNVIEGPPHEALSLPIQQMSRTFLLHEAEIPSEEVVNLERFIPAFRAYDPTCADGPKGVFFDDYYKLHKAEFFSIWIKYGLKYPLEYLNALLAVTRNYYIPYALPGDYLLYLDWNVRLEDFHMPIEVTRSPLLGFEFLNGYYYRAAYLPESYQNIPILGLFFNTGFTFWYFIITLVFLCVKKRRIGLLLSIPLIGTFGILLLGPLSCMRYAWGLWLSLPFVLLIDGADLNAVIRKKRYGNPIK